MSYHTQITQMANDLVNCNYYKKIKNSRGVNAKPPTITANKNAHQNGPGGLPDRAIHKHSKKSNDVFKSGDFAQATLHDVTTPANGGSSTKRKTKRLANQYRPNANAASGSRNVNAGKSSKNSQGSGAGSSGPNNKRSCST